MGSAIRIEGQVKTVMEMGKGRMIFVASCIFLCFFIIAMRVVDLGAKGGMMGSAVAAPVASRGDDMERGRIYDRNGVLLATSLKVPSLYANPSQIRDANAVAEELHALLPDLDKERLVRRLSGDRQFVWIKRHLHPKEKLAVNDLGIPGLYFQDEEKRVYPHGSLASHVLGLVGLDGDGLGGVEKEFNAQLAERDLHLSLDIRVQQELHASLDNALKEYDAKGAAGVVMDAKNGEIVAMVSLPDFDPNHPSKVRGEHMFNRATLGVYEMGSTFKNFTIATALDKQSAGVDDFFDARSDIKYGRYTIGDFHGKKRWLSLPEVLMYSSNIGAAKIANTFGQQTQKEYLARLGLLDALPVELPEKSLPLYPNNWGDIRTMTVAYGHGIAVTPLHVAAANLPLVNGGVYYNPTLLKTDGQVDGNRILKAQTSDTMRRLLRLVVTEGTGGNADVEGYYVGGKTGTAEKPGADKYSDDRRVSSFVGAFPMQDPQYVVVVVIDEPKGNESTHGYATAGYTAAPVMRDMVRGIALLNGIAPVSGDAAADIRHALHLPYHSVTKKLTMNNR